MLLLFVYNSCAIHILQRYALVCPARWSWRKDDLSLRNHQGCHIGVGSGDCRCKLCSHPKPYFRIHHNRTRHLPVSAPTLNPATSPSSARSVSHPQNPFFSIFSIAIHIETFRTKKSHHDPRRRLVLSPQKIRKGKPSMVSTNPEFQCKPSLKISFSFQSPLRASGWFDSQVRPRSLPSVLPWKVLSYRLRQGGCST